MATLVGSRHGGSYRTIHFVTFPKLNIFEKHLFLHVQDEESSKAKKNHEAAQATSQPASANIKQAGKRAKKQASKQASRQASKEASKQASKHTSFAFESEILHMKSAVETE